MKDEDTEILRGLLNQAEKSVESAKKHFTKSKIETCITHLKRLHEFLEKVKILGNQIMTTLATVYAAFLQIVQGTSKDVTMNDLKAAGEFCRSFAYPFEFA